MRHGFWWGLVVIGAFAAILVGLAMWGPRGSRRDVAPIHEAQTQNRTMTGLELLEMGNKTDSEHAGHEDEGPVESPEEVSELAPRGQAALDLPKLAREARPAVMLLVVYDKDGKEIATGTGFLISSDGKLVTNYHVIEKAAKVIAKAENGGLFPVAGVLAQDAKADLVLLKLEGKDLPSLKLGSAEKIEVGTRVAVIGSPLGLEGTLSEGIVSAVRELEILGGRWLQISAAISPGSSGSPVLNEKGEVVGVAVAIMREGQSLNFAVPVEEVKKLLAEAEKTGKAKELGKEATREDGAIRADPDFRAAVEAFLVSDNVEMLKHAKKLLQRYPEDAEAHSLNGAAYLTLGFWDEAVVAYKQAIKIRPDYADAWYYLGYVYEKAGKTDEGIAAYKQAIKIKPDHAEAWGLLGSAYSSGKQYNEAISAYKQSLKLKPDAAGIWCLLGIAYGYVEQYSEAISAHKQAIKLKPDFVEAWQGLGFACEASKQYSDAIAAYRQVIKLKPDDAFIWSLLGFAYVKNGQKEKALEVLGSLRKLDPEKAAELEKYIGP